MTGWLVQRYEKVLKDADTTFCDKVNTLENVRHNNKTESNVPLLELLKFNKVRQIFLLLFKVNSVQEACTKCLAVHISKFETLQITYKK